MPAVLKSSKQDFVFTRTVCDVLCTALQKMRKNLLGHLLYRSVLLTQNGNNSTSLPSCRNLLINNEVALDIGHVKVMIAIRMMPIPCHLLRASREARESKGVYFFPRSPAGPWKDLVIAKQLLQGCVGTWVLGCFRNTHFQQQKILTKWIQTS